MMRQTPLRLLLPAFLLLACAPAIAEEPATSTLADCDTFAAQWNVAQELALLAMPVTDVQASDGGDEARIEPGKPYRVQLHPQPQVALPAPGKPTLNEDDMAGLLAFRMPADGRYRIAYTSGHWIDVIDAGQPLTSIPLHHRHACERVQKIVEYDLPGGRELVLQFAGSSVGTMDIVIAPAPAATQ